MSCVKHPTAKLYLDKSNGRTRCSGCVKATVSQNKERKKYPLGRVTEEILASLGGTGSGPEAAVHTMHIKDQSWAQCVNAITQ